MSALTVATLLIACNGSGTLGGGGGNTAGAPTISIQPASQTVSAGATAIFSVTATGTAPLAYQWEKNGTAITGASSASYTTPATVASDNGASFSVVVSNSAGQVTSSAATLTVNGQGTPPTFSSQPQSQTVAEGSTATFSALATGSGLLTYQWEKNGVPIAGATSIAYTAPATIVADSGETLTVVVTGSGGQATSNPAVLTVTALRTGNADPEGIYYGSITFSSQPQAWPAMAIVLKDGTASVFAIQSFATSEVPVGVGLTGVKVTTTNSGFTSSFTAHTQTGYTLTNGRTSATGTLSGTVVPGVSISGSFNSTLDSGTFNLTASPVSYQPSSSTGLIGGTYHHSYAVSAGGTVKVYDVNQVIAADGTGAGTDTANCTYTSKYTVPDANHNAYNVTLTSSCPSQQSQSYTGLGAFFPAGSSGGAALNSGLNGVSQGVSTGISNFATDTVVSIVDSGATAYLIFASK